MYRQVLKSVTSPTPRWGPARAKDRTGRYALPKEDTSKVENELPHYWYAVKMWSGGAESQSESGPPSYKNGGGSSSSGGPEVQSVSVAVPMTSVAAAYDVIGGGNSSSAAADEARVSTTYDVVVPLSQVATTTAAVNRSSNSSSRSDSATSVTKADVYSDIQHIRDSKRKSKVSAAGGGAGVDNAAFQNDDDTKSTASRDSSVDGAPVPGHDAMEASTAF